MFLWYLWCFWNPSIPFYSLPPSVFHPASFATFCSNWNLKPFLLSRAGRSQVRDHLAWSLGCIQAPWIGWYWGWYSRGSNTILKCIIHGWMSVTWERFQSLWNCSCRFHTGEVPLSLRPRHPSHWQKYSRCSLPVAQHENPWLLTLAQEDMRYKQVFLGFQHS